MTFSGEISLLISLLISLHISRRIFQRNFRAFFLHSTITQRYFTALLHSTFTQRIYSAYLLSTFRSTELFAVLKSVYFARNETRHIEDERKNRPSMAKRDHFFLGSEIRVNARLFEGRVKMRAAATVADNRGAAV